MISSLISAPTPTPFCLMYPLCIHRIWRCAAHTAAGDTAQCAIVAQAGQLLAGHDLGTDLQDADRIAAACPRCCCRQHFAWHEHLGNDAGDSRRYEHVIR